MFTEHLEAYICILKKSSVTNCSDSGADKTGVSLLSGHCTAKSGKFVFKKHSSVGLLQSNLILISGLLNCSLIGILLLKYWSLPETHVKVWMRHLN